MTLGLKSTEGLILNAVRDWWISYLTIFEAGSWNKTIPRICHVITLKNFQNVVPFLKAENDHLAYYKTTLPFLVNMKSAIRYSCIFFFFLIQRKFVASSPTSKDGTYKKFGQWLKETYVNGQPSQAEMQAVVDEDAAFNYQFPNDLPIEQYVPFDEYPEKGGTVWIMKWSNASLFILIIKSLHPFLLYP